MLSKKGNQARKSQSMKFLHRPLVVFFNSTQSGGFGLPTLLLSGAVENLPVASTSLRLLRSQREPDSPRLSCSEDILRDRGGRRRSPVYDFYTWLPFYDIQDHVLFVQCVHCL